MHLPHCALTSFFILATHTLTHTHAHKGQRKMLGKFGESKITYLKAISIFFFFFFPFPFVFFYTASVDKKLSPKNILKIPTHISIKTQISTD